MKREGPKGWTIVTVALATLLLTLSMFAPGTASAANQYMIDCTFCHKMAPLDSGTATKNALTGAVPGNHQTHAPATGAVAADCVVCHTNAVNSFTNSHRDGTIQLVNTWGYARDGWANQVPNGPTLGTCSNVACHSDGADTPAYQTTPTWGTSPASVTCTTCHDLARTTGSHAKHATYYGSTDGGDCVKCHNDRTGNYQHALGGQTAGITLNVELTGKFNTGNSQCSNLYCHSNGQSGGAAVFATPTWGGAAATCTSCHGNATSGTLSGKHAAHVNNAAVLGTSYGCVDCHDQTVSSNTVISNTANHVDNTKTMSADFSCADCHQDGKGMAKTVNWTDVTDLDCKGCHGSDVAPAFTSKAGEPNYVNAGAGVVRANSHLKHVGAAADCVSCHNGTTTTGTSISGSNHTNGMINVVKGGTADFTYTEVDKTCAASSCHSSGGLFTAKTAQWGATGTCATCHDDAGTLASNSHSQHLAKASITCAACHSTTASSNSALVAAGTHMSNAIEVAGSATFNGTNNTCATACHGSATPTWGQAATGACGTCHGTTGGTLPVSHNTHLAAANGPGASCETCHPAYGSADHADLGLDLLSGMNASGTCGTCHTVTATWGTAASVTCESCHTGTGSTIVVAAPLKNNAATTGHGKALGANKACTDCHDAGSAHITGALGQNRLLAALGTGNVNCTYCHNDPVKVTNVDMQNLPTHMTLTCADCHDPHGTLNASMIHRATFSGSDFANAGGTGICQTCHIESTPGVWLTNYYHAGVEETVHNVGSNCLDCHSHKDQAGAFMPTSACDSCHGYPPAPTGDLNGPLVSGTDYRDAGKWANARVENYMGGGGAHLTHLPADLTLDTYADTGTYPAGVWTPCLPCHFDGATAHAKTTPLASNVGNISVKVDTQYTFSQGTAIAYAKVVGGVTDPAQPIAPNFGSETGSCFNVSCHFQPTKKWSTAQ